jgi:hypothetical protein
MSKVPSVFLSLMFFVAFSCCASPAGADPVRVTSGVVATGFAPLGEPWDANELVLTGAGFSIGTPLEDEVAFVQLATLPTLALGALLDLSGVLHVEDAIGARLDNLDTVVAAPFEMSFDASPIPLDCRSGGSLTECSGIAPFTFDAELTFTAFGGVPVTHHIIGGGTAEGSLFRLGSFESGAVRYMFEPNAVPEPTTLSLFTTTAIVAGARAWRRRRAGYRGA